MRWAACRVEWEQAVAADAAAFYKLTIPAAWGEPGVLLFTASAPLTTVELLALNGARVARTVMLRVGAPWRVRSRATRQVAWMWRCATSSPTSRS